MGLWNDIAGVADHAAGSVDEAVGRQFDDQQGGGVFDADTYTGIADHAAGSIDEAVGRQFDDEAGGGVADEVADTVWSTAAGQADWWAGDVDETVGGAADDAADAAGTAAAAGRLLVPAAAVAVGVAVLSARDDRSASR